MSDQFPPPDWFMRPNPWAPWIPNTASNGAPTSPATAPTAPALPTNTSDQNDTRSFHHGGFNWVETPNGGLLAVHSNPGDVEWVETPSGGLLAYPKRPVNPSWPRSAMPEHLDSARYWGAARSPASAERMLGNHPYPSLAPQVPSWDQVPARATAGAAQIFAEPPSPTSWGAPAASADATAVSTPDESAMAQDAFRAAAERVRRGVRRTTVAPDAAPPLAGLSALPPESPIPPTVPLSGFGDLNARSVSPPAPPASPKDFRTWLSDVLSDKNVRYYAGPHLWEAIQKLRALVPLLPGSGTVESMEDGARAGEDFEAGNYGHAAAHLGMGTVNAGLDWIPGGKFLAIPLGVAAKNFPRARLKIAEEMEAAGYSTRDVTRETGLYRGKEGEWRFEASDAGYHVRPDVGQLDPEGYRVASLFEHHVHPALREAYPHFANITSRMKIDPSRDPKGSFNPRTNTLTIRARNIEEAERHGIHELVHPVQEYEGHARGGGIGTIIELLLRGMSWDDAIKSYTRLAGEAEAVNAERRLRWSDAQRRAEPFPETEMPPRDQQIVR